jgi:hypothetical protein
MTPIQTMTTFFLKIKSTLRQHLWPTPTDLEINIRANSIDVPHDMYREYPEGQSGDEFKLDGNMALMIRHQECAVIPLKDILPQL